ncbi:MAG: hypothetical protein N3D12_06115 [Candidatus Methanomethyliaceae archaeon]|nr:hypothetical protein [Candidatus Methanomethyliaceae archaeon]
MEEVDDLEVATNLFKKYERCPSCGHLFNGKPKRIYMSSKVKAGILAFAKQR